MDELFDLATVLRVNAQQGRVWARTGHRKPSPYLHTVRRVSGRVSGFVGRRWKGLSIALALTLFVLHVIVWYHAPGNAGFVTPFGGFEYRGPRGMGFFGPSAD